MATKPITESLDAQRAKATLRALTEGGAACQSAASALGGEFRRLEGLRAEAVKSVADAKASVLAGQKASRERMAKERRDLLVPMLDQHRKISALLDELLSRLARVKDTIA